MKSILVAFLAVQRALSASAPAGHKYIAPGPNDGMPKLELHKAQIC